MKRKKKGSQAGSLCHSNEVRPAWFTQSATAKRLGISDPMLIGLGREHRLYAPAVRGFPCGNGKVGNRLVRYHSEQIRLIEAVLAGNRELETAALEWEVARRNNFLFFS